MSTALSGAAGRHDLTYRLNPYYFLSDRKIWILVGVLVQLATYGLASYMMATSAALASGQPGVFAPILALFLAAPAAIHVVIPYLDHRGKLLPLADHGRRARAWKLVGDGRSLQNIPPAELLRGAALLCDRHGLGRVPATQIVILLRALHAVHERLLPHIALVSGRDPSAETAPRMRLSLIRGSGSPYCYARAFGRVHIVVPMESIPSSEGEASEYARHVLSHELSHVLLRDEPLQIFSDVRLVSIAAAIQSASAILLGIVAVSIPFTEAGQKVHAASVVTLACVVGVSIAALPVLTSLLVGRLAALWRVIIALSWCALSGAIAGVGQLTVPVRIGVLHAEWPVVVTMMILAVTLGRLCVFLGRQQIELLADEASIHAIARPDAADILQVRRALVSVLTRIERRTREASRAEAPRAYVVGHSAREWGEPEPPRVRRASRALLTVLLGWTEDLLHRIGRSIHRMVIMVVSSHPTLRARVSAVTQPDLLVTERSTAPLIYSSLSLMLFPILLNRMAPSVPAMSAMMGSLFIPVLALFLWLFVIIARRPTTGGALHEGIDVGVEALFSGGTPSPAPAHRPRVQRLAAPGRVRRAATGRDDDSDPHLHDRVRRAGLLRIEVNPHSAGERRTGSAGGSWTSSSTHLGAELLRTCASFLVAGSIAVGVDRAIQAIVSRASEPQTVAGVSVPVAILALSVNYLSWFVLCKFFCLSQWHFYMGTSWIRNAMLQGINLTKAVLIAGLMLGALTMLVHVGRASLAATCGLFGVSIAPALQDSSLLASEGFGEIAGALSLAMGYAAVVCWWPSLPAKVRCPEGHETEMTYRDVLRRGDGRTPDDWGWLRCTHCDRSPHEGRLVSDAEGATVRRKRTATGAFVLVAVLAGLFGFYPALLAISTPTLVDAIRVCGALPRDPAADVAFADCGSDPDALPVPPKGDSLIVAKQRLSATEIPPLGAPVTDLVMALRMSTREDDVVGQMVIFPASCRNWTTLLRNEIAFAQLCAYGPRNSEPIVCPDTDTLMSRQQACACIWAVGADGTPDKARREEAAERFGLNLLIIFTEGVRADCNSPSADGAEQFLPWTAYSDRSMDRIKRLVGVASNPTKPATSSPRPQGQPL